MRGPLWSLKLTHIPTGIEVIRTSDHFRNQHLARDSAMKYLKSRLHWLGKEVEEGQVVTVYERPDDMTYPRELDEYRGNKLT